MSIVKDTLKDWQQLADWLNRERKARNNIPIRELARQAGISHGVVAKMANGQGPFRVESLNAIADALDTPREKVQQLAGLLPDTGETLPEVAAWSLRLKTLSEENRRRAVSAMEGVLLAVENAAIPPRR